MIVAKKFDDIFGSWASFTHPLGPQAKNAGDCLTIGNTLFNVQIVSKAMPEFTRIH